MKKRTPSLYRKFSPNYYKREFEKIDNNIQNMDDIDFEITINTDIFFYIDFMVSLIPCIKAMITAPIIGIP